jgi:hypothetical protein
MQIAFADSTAIPLIKPEGRGNAGPVESVENQTQLFHAFHSPLKIPQTRRDLHISTAPMMTVLSLNQKRKKRQRKEVGRYSASSFPIPLCPWSSGTDFMLILQLENAVRLVITVGPLAQPSSNAPESAHIRES